MSFEFIEPLEEKPEIGKKSYKRSVAERILNEFMKSEAKYAKVSFDKIKNFYKSPAFASRALGRVSKRLGLKDKISIYSDEDNVYLEKI